MKTKTKLEKLAEARRLLTGETNNGLPDWLPDQEVYVFFQEDDEQKYLTKGRDGKDVYLNQAAFDQLEVDIQPTGKQILLIKTERLEVLQKIVDEGQAMEAEKQEPLTIPDIAPEQSEPDPETSPVHTDEQPEPVPEPEAIPDQEPPSTTLFVNNQPTDAQIYFRRRAEAKRKTHF